MYIYIFSFLCQGQSIYLFFAFPLNLACGALEQKSPPALMGLFFLLTKTRLILLAEIGWSVFISNFHKHVFPSPEFSFSLYIYTYIYIITLFYAYIYIYIYYYYYSILCVYIYISIYISILLLYSIYIYIYIYMYYYYYYYFFTPCKFFILLVIGGFHWNTNNYRSPQPPRTLCIWTVFNPNVVWAV